MDVVEWGPKLHTLCLGGGVLLTGRGTCKIKDSNTQVRICVRKVKQVYIAISHTYMRLSLSLSLSLSLIRAYCNIYLLYFPHTYSYLSIRVLCFADPPSCQRHPSKPTCEVSDPLNHVHPDMSLF